MRPIANRLLLTIPDDPKVKMSGTLFIPDTVAKEQFPEANVVAVGPKCVDVKAGDVVVVDRYAIETMRVTIKGKPYFLIAEPHVFAIVN